MKLNIFFIMVLMFLMVPAALGMQKISVNNGELVKIKLSSRELTRITVDGGRIERFWGPSGMLESQVDKKEGELFVRPSSLAGNAFSFFIRDNFGSTYTLVAEQVDIPSQTIILSPTNRLSSSEKEMYKNRSVVLKIKELIKIMARNNISANKVAAQEKNEEIPLWKESRLLLIRSYQLDKLQGEVYILKNISSANMQLLESEFLNFRTKVLAVAIEKLSLKASEETRIFLVRRGE